MKEPLILTTLQPYVQTSYDVAIQMNIIEKLQTAFFKNNQSFIETLDKQIPYPLSNVLKQLAASHEVDLTNGGDAQRFFSKLQETIQEMPLLHITLSIQPTKDLLNELALWFTRNVSTAIVIDFAIDKTLIGGIQLGFQGKYKDYSIKKQLASSS